jgi:hypothetical protein
MKFHYVKGKTRISAKAKLYNLGLSLKDATVNLQNSVAAASAAASSPASVADLVLNAKLREGLYLKAGLIVY